MQNSNLRDLGQIYLRFLFSYNYIYKMMTSDILKTCAIARMRTIRRAQGVALYVPAARGRA